MLLIDPVIADLPPEQLLFGLMVIVFAAGVVAGLLAGWWIKAAPRIWAVLQEGFRGHSAEVEDAQG